MKMKYLMWVFIIIIITVNSSYAQIKTETEILKEVNEQITNINTQQLLEILDKQANVTLIDVRTANEIMHTGTIARGQNQRIERGWLEFKIKEYAKNVNSPIVVYCGTNLRSPLAALSLQKMGYTNVKNYADGYFSWKEQKLPIWISDQATQSILYSYPELVEENVYSAIGATQPPTYENSNHNNNLSFIVTSKGVLVFNAGGNYLLAKAMHKEIKKITKQPVRYVVLENSQGHAMLGSSYWQEQGAKIIAHKYAAEIIQTNGDLIYQQAQSVLGDKLEYTKIVKPDIIFEDKYVIKMGDEVFEILYLGESHSHDDIQMWLPNRKLLISGDTAFNERMLPIFPHTKVKEWLKTWEKLVALEPKTIIPGHGKVTDLATVTKFTKNYLEFMVEKVTQMIDDGKELPQAYDLDQSQFRDWKTYQELHRQNAGRIFMQLEFE